MTQIPTSIPTTCGRRYFTESCKIFTAFATITDDHTDGLWPSIFYQELLKIYCPCHNHRRCFWQNHRRSCKFQCVWLSECQVGQPVYRWHHRRTLQIQCEHALRPIYRRTCRWTSKILEGFLKFQCEIQNNTDGIYRRKFIATARKILF
jgi:hypothetical protein